MLPYGLVKGKIYKGFGPSLDKTNIELMKSVNKKNLLKNLAQSINL